MNAKQAAQDTSEFDREFVLDTFGEPDEAARDTLERATALGHNRATEAQMGSEKRTIDIPGLMEALSQQRPIFHSEADFQHEFAWLLRVRTPEAAIRLERPFNVSGQKLHVDLLVRKGNRDIAVELKYKTRALSTKIGPEHFDLASHSAQNHGRYDYLADIERVEKLGSVYDRTTGYAILLTNDSAYWKKPQTKHTVDASFRIHEGRKVHGRLAWGRTASARTTKSRKKPLMLLGTYAMRWKDYSKRPDHAYGQFRWLLARVGPARQRAVR